MCEAGGTDETGVAKIGENGEIPLYCSRPGVRLIISLLDGDEHTRYWKLPDAVVDVHQNLGELAKNNGDYERAERELRACIKLAPTSVRFYEELSQVYARTDEYGKAADVLIGALKSQCCLSIAKYSTIDLATHCGSWDVCRKRSPAMR